MSKWLKNKRPSFLGFFFILFLVFSLVGDSYSQDAMSLGKLRQEYYQANSQYVKQREEFNFARARHLSYQSLSSEAEAIAASKELILSKAELLASYLRLIKEHFAYETKVENYQENLSYLQFDNQITELGILKSKVSPLQSLADLEKIDQDLGQKHQRGWKLGYKSLGQIKAKKFENYFAQLESHLSSYNRELEQKEGPDEQTLVLIQKRIAEAESQLAELKSALDSAAKQFLNSVESRETENSYRQFLEIQSRTKSGLLELIKKMEVIIVQLS